MELSTSQARNQTKIIKEVKNLRWYLQASLPIFSLRESFNLFVEVNNNFLVLLLEQMGRFFGFQMDVLKKFAHFGQLNIALAIDFELKTRERRKEVRRSALKCLAKWRVLFTWLSAPPSASSRRSESEITCTLKSVFSRSICKKG